MTAWWNSVVVYQIYPRSFAGSEGTGSGDLDGIRRHLDHLEWLGVHAVWLSPFYQSPLVDGGYDVSDYCDVDPRFGTLGDFDALVAEAHRRQLKVLIDWVPNHSSDRHPWFVESRSDRDNPRRDWYIWRDPSPGGGPPNNWIRSWAQLPAWTFDDTTGQYYLHEFLPQQPDLNWANPEVQAAMHDTLRFWLDRGVDGFRMDVIHLIGKDPALPDDPPDLVALGHVPLNDRPETHALLRGIRAVLDGYDGDRVAVGEVWLMDPARVATYYGDNDEVHLAFNFPPMFEPWDAARWRAQVARAEEVFSAAAAWPVWVLSNHDNPRHRTRYGGSEARARAAAVLLLTLRGTPFLFAGEEIGLEDAVIPPDRVTDPGGRDGCRAPIPWDATPEHGWGTDDPWLPWPPGPGTRNVASQRDDPSSILHLYRRVLAARAASPALGLGSLELVEVESVDSSGVVGYRRRHDRDTRVVLINFDETEVMVSGLEGIIEVSTTAVNEGKTFTGRLGPNEAVILHPVA